MNRLSRPPGWKRGALALLLFGISFGYVEASVVTYLSALYEPLRQRIYPGRSSSDVFPLLPVDELKAADPQYLRLLNVELARSVEGIVATAPIGALL